MPKPFVAIGGDAAGLSAASKCKREDPDREVIVYEKGEWISYAHCGMPSYVKGEVDSLGDLLSLSPDEVTERGIDLRRTHEITAIDTEAGVVRGEGPELQRLDLTVMDSIRYAYPFECKLVTNYKRIIIFAVSMGLNCRRLSVPTAGRPQSRPEVESACATRR